MRWLMDWSNGRDARRACRITVCGALFFLIGGGAVSAQDPFIEEAERAYRDGRYDDARDTYRTMLETSPLPDGRLEYNLGNCEYRLGRYARALWWYERARRRLGEREELTFNCSLALRRLGFGVSSEQGLLASVREKVADWGSGTWFWIGVVLEAFGLVCLALCLQRAARVRVILMVLFVGGAGLFFYQSSRVDEEAPRGVVILEDDTQLRAEPRTELPGVIELRSGVRGRYIAETPAWIKVRIRDRAGWVPLTRAGVY